MATTAAAAGALTADQKKAVIAASIRVIPDFPKKGIMFQDVSTLLLDPVAFQHTIDLFVARYKKMGVQCVAGARWLVGWGGVLWGKGRFAVWSLFSRPRSMLNAQTPLP